MQLNIAIFEFDQKSILYWNDQYYSSNDIRDAGDDEREYQRLLNLVGDDIRGSKSIDKVTMQAIVQWAHMEREVGSHIDYSNYGRRYVPAIRDVITGRINDQVAITMMDTLPGFGPVFASKVLHFIRPGKFPIIDQHLVEVLYLYSKIGDIDTSQVALYAEYQKYLMRLAKREKTNFHQIDRALWAYHVLKLNPAINSIFQQDCNKKLPSPIDPVIRTPKLDLRNVKLRKDIIDRLKIGIRSAESFL
jgi:hypothetical protein